MLYCITVLKEVKREFEKMMYNYQYNKDSLDKKMIDF